MRGGEVPFEGFGQTVGIAFDVEDLHCAVRGAGCKSTAVVIQDCIVLEIVSSWFHKADGAFAKCSIHMERGTHYHFIMASVRDNLCHVDTEFFGVVVKILREDN